MSSLSTPARVTSRYTAGQVPRRTPEDEKRCAAAVRGKCLPSAETDIGVKDVNCAGDANEK